MPWSYFPAPPSAWFASIVAALDRPSAPRLLRLLGGAILARGPRTVTSWFRAANITDDFRPAYSAIRAAIRRAGALAYRLLWGALRGPAGLGPQLLFAIGNTLTARYGPCLQGAGVHHNPTPGPADQ